MAGMHPRNTSDMVHKRVFIIRFVSNSLGHLGLTYLGYVIFLWTTLYQPVEDTEVLLVVSSVVHITLLMILLWQ